MDIGIVRTPVIGSPGKSAYELAVAEGFNGTLEEWLVSLKGERGLRGPTGATGSIGIQGDPGESSYEIAVANGYQGTEVDWYSQFDPATIALKVIYAIKPLVTVWNTELVSSGSSNTNQITLPLKEDGEYNFLVDWGDGSQELITQWNNSTHTYSKPGKYLIAIRGVITGWSFNNSGDKLKLLSIYQWGNLKLTNAGGSFYGCQNLRVFADEILNTVNCTNFSNFFRGCSNLNNIKGINYINTSSVTNMSGMFKDSNFNVDISNWDFRLVTNFSDFLEGNSVFSSINYDLLLNSIAEQSNHDNVQLDAPLISYTTNASASRALLISKGWLINDAGLAG